MGAAAAPINLAFPSAKHSRWSHPSFPGTKESRKNEFLRPFPQKFVLPQTSANHSWGTCPRCVVAPARLRIRRLFRFDGRHRRKWRRLFKHPTHPLRPHHRRLALRHRNPCRLHRPCVRRFSYEKSTLYENPYLFTGTNANLIAFSSSLAPASCVSAQFCRPQRWTHPAPARPKAKSRPAT